MARARVPFTAALEIAPPHTKLTSPWCNLRHGPLSTRPASDTSARKQAALKQRTIRPIDADSLSLPLPAQAVHRRAHPDPPFLKGGEAVTSHKQRTQNTSMHAKISLSGF